nr:hypothetical protein [Anaerolineae bacterium]
MGRYPSDTIRGTGSPSGAEQGHSTLHFEPLFYGSLGGTAFTFPAPPVTKQEALQQPLTPLLPALDCCPLPPPGASKLTPPPGLQIKVGPLSGSRRLSML